MRKWAEPGRTASPAKCGSRLTRHTISARPDVYKRQAYDKAVEVVTDTVRQETHKEDIRLVEESKKWVLSPERKAPKKEREYAAARLDGVINKIKNVMQDVYMRQP